MKKMMTALAVAALAAVPAMAIQHQGAAARGGESTTPAGELGLYEMTGYNGDYMMVDRAMSAVHTDWNIRSISVHPGDRWQICARPRFQECIVLDRSVADAHLIGVQGQIGSARPAPPPAAPAQPH